MDPLSDLLRVVRLNGAYFYTVEASDPWCAETVPAADLSPQVMPEAEHLISYHVLTEGRCFGGLVGEEPVELVPGDVIVFPHGDAHVMAGEAHPDTSALISDAIPRFPFTLRYGGGRSPGATLVCGFLGCDLRPFNPLLAALPRRMHMRGLSNAWLGTFIRQVTEETRAGRAGAETVLTKLAELMFVEVLRRYLDELPPGQGGWLAGLRDETVGRALTLLHADPARAWTLETLARESASSRSNLAERFTAFVGQPPMHYLAQWRMQVAANRLSQGNAKVATIAAEVGYESEAAFSRAFKRSTGSAPGTWRSTRGTARG